MRTLRDNEIALLVKLTDSVEGGAEFAQQLSHVRVRDDSTPTFLRLQVDDYPGVPGVADGPIPGRFPVVRNGELLGEMMVWVTNGRLAGLEFSWVTDLAPAHMPNADEVQID